MTVEVDRNQAVIDRKLGSTDVFEECYDSNDASVEHHEMRSNSKIPVVMLSLQSGFKDTGSA